MSNLSNARAQLEEWEAKKPEDYTSKYKDRIDGTLGSECFGIHGAAVGIPSLRHWNSNLRL